MDLPCGAIARDDKFFCRKSDQEKVWRYLKNDHVILSGPRWVGKSSLAARLVRDAAANGFKKAELIDLEGCDSADEAVKCIEKVFPASAFETVVNAADGLLKSATKVRPRMSTADGQTFSLELTAKETAPDRADWKLKAESLKQRLLPQKLLICLDEFSVFLSKILQADRAAGESFVGWLRGWRLNPIPTNCRFIFSGSIGLNSLLDSQKLTTYFNDCLPYSLGPFPRPDALEMMATVCRNNEMEAQTEVLENICDRIGWLSPYFLNLMLTEAANQARYERSPQETAIRLVDIKGAYANLLANRGQFTHWHQRLLRDLKEPRLGLALKILGVIAKTDQGLTHQQLRARVSRKIKNDGDFANILTPA